jgi:thiamine transport system substrate-binding protein
MNQLMTTFLWLFFLSFLSVSHKAFSAKETLTVFTYDSLMAKGGLGKAIFPLFEKKCNCTLKIVSAGDSGQMVNRVQIDYERKKPKAQIVFGIDQNLWDQVKPFSEPWAGWKPKDLDKLFKGVWLEDGFLPFDYGVHALMIDQEYFKKKSISTPRTLNDLLNPEYKGTLLLQDPRVSSPGLSFVSFVKNIKKAEFSDYFKKLKPQWLTLTQGWDAAYNLFLKGEAPMVWSYTTSQAYHQENGDKNNRYIAIVFEEGQPLQVEGAVMMKDTLKNEAQKKLAKDFMDFIISKEAQDLIPLTNWMIPARTDASLPKTFTSMPKAKKLIQTKLSKPEMDQLLKEWSAAIR